MSSSIDVFISNLKLLGFEKSAHCKGLLSMVSLERDMFTRGASNTKQFEATSHFLFKTLDKTQCNRRFKTCWPLQDYMHQSREYRTIAFRWLEQIRQTSVIMQKIPLRKSYFEDCRGIQFEHIMVGFSTFVLETVLLKDKSTSMDIDTNVWSLDSEEFSHRVQHDIQQVAQSFNDKSKTVEMTKKEWAVQGREIISELNRGKENNRFSSTTEIEHRAKQKVEEVMPKIKPLKAKFKESKPNNNSESKELRHKIYNILTTKQLANDIYILPPLPKSKLKLFTFLRKKQADEEKDLKEKDFRDLFQKENNDGVLHFREISRSPRKSYYGTTETVFIEEKETMMKTDSQVISEKTTIPPLQRTSYTSSYTPLYRTSQDNSTPQKTFQDINDNNTTTATSIRTPQDSSTPQKTLQYINNSNNTPIRTPIRTPQRYVYSASSAVSSIFPDLGSVESIRHEEPPWTPDLMTIVQNRRRRSGSEHDLFDLYNETPIRGPWEQ